MFLIAFHARAQVDFVSKRYKCTGLSLPNALNRVSLRARGTGSERRRADAVEIQVTSGQRDHASEGLATQAAIIVAVHKTAATLTHCTASVQWLQCLHTV